MRKQLQEVRNDQKLNAKIKEEKIKEVEKKIQILEQEKTRIQAEKCQKNQKTEDNSKTPIEQETETEKTAIDGNTQKAFAKWSSLKR